MEIVSRSKINCVQKSSSPKFCFAVTGTSLRILGAKVHFPLPDLGFCAHSVLRKSAAFQKATPVAGRDDTLVRNRLFHKRTLRFYCVGVCSPGFEILLTEHLDKYPHLSRVMVAHCPVLLPTDLRLLSEEGQKAQKHFFPLGFSRFSFSFFPLLIFRVVID